MQHQPNPAGGSHACFLCLRPARPMPDERGDFSCDPCLRYALGADEGQAEAGLDLIRSVIRAALQDRYVHPDDLRRAFEEELAAVKPPHRRTWKQIMDMQHALYVERGGR